MIHIKISGFVNFSMTVYKTDTVQKIKETIQEKGNIPIDEIVLTHKHILKNDEILKDLKIKNNSNLNCYIENSISGGTPLGLDMANIANKEGLEKRNFGKNAKKWNIITKGLNIEGVCTNSNCEAYNYKVDCQIGLGDFNLLENICKIKCPMCSKYIELETCSFCKCQYQIEGTLSLSGETKDIEETKTEWIRVEKDYEYYDPNKSGIVNWLMLIIETKSL